MTVQQLIDELMEIEDKEQVVEIPKYDSCEYTECSQVSEQIGDGVWIF